MFDTFIMVVVPCFLYEISISKCFNSCLDKDVLLPISCI